LVRIDLLLMAWFGSRRRFGAGWPITDKQRDSSYHILGMAQACRKDTKKGRDGGLDDETGFYFAGVAAR
jgi:hypothetical protein